MTNLDTLPAKYINPYRYIMYLLAKQTESLFSLMGLTPTIIRPPVVTSISLICAVVSIYLFYKGNYYWAALFNILTYFLDVLDSHIAEKYGMSNTFNSVYDLLTELIFFFILEQLLAKHFKKLVEKNIVSSRTYYIWLVLTYVFTITLVFHDNCKIVYFTREKKKGEEVAEDEKTEDDSLVMKVREYLCPFKQETIDKILPFSRFLGDGTFFLFKFFTIFYIIYQTWWGYKYKPTVGEILQQTMQII